MNESVVKPEALGLPPARESNDFILGAYGIVGFLGGLCLSASTHQHDLAVSGAEIWGTAALAAFGGLSLTDKVRHWRYNRRLNSWLADESHLYTKEINTEVKGHFENGYQVLVNWAYRQEKKKRT
ncbi:MAG TPA: hypothetical protein VHB72_05035 [Candidatus Saccharimonadales bacterium]|nr:hypothetical protein [Candidatus Saccharimonadales bacterium]